MASISEWIDHFKNLKKREKIKIILKILGILVGLWAASYYFNINIGSNQINIQNSNLTNSPTIQNSPNTSIAYKTEEFLGIPNTMSYTKESTITNDVKPPVNFYFVKVILPDGQEAFLEEVLSNKTYHIALCNEELTDCYIYSKFRVKKDLAEEQICWIDRFSGNNSIQNKWIPSKKYQKESDKCWSYAK